MDYAYLPDISHKTFNVKSDKVKRLIRESLQVIEMLGIPTDDLSDRRKERLAMTLLAVGDVKKSSEWKKLRIGTMFIL